MNVTEHVWHQDWFLVVDSSSLSTWNNYKHLRLRLQHLFATNLAEPWNLNLCGDLGRPRPGDLERGARYSGFWVWPEMDNSDDDDDDEGLTKPIYI